MFGLWKVSVLVENTAPDKRDQTRTPASKMSGRGWPKALATA